MMDTFVSKEGMVCFGFKEVEEKLAEEWKGKLGESFIPLTFISVGQEALNYGTGHNFVINTMMVKTRVDELKIDMSKMEKDIKDALGIK